jgi:hypothetical protein
MVLIKLEPNSEPHHISNRNRNSKRRTWQIVRRDEEVDFLEAKGIERHVDGC